jgi:hypothetical protein
MVFLVWVQGFRILGLDFVGNPPLSALAPPHASSFDQNTPQGQCGYRPCTATHVPDELPFISSTTASRCHHQHLQHRRRPFGRIEAHRHCNNHLDPDRFQTFVPDLLHYQARSLSYPILQPCTAPLRLLEQPSFLERQTIQLQPFDPLGGATHRTAVLEETLDLDV